MKPLPTEDLNHVLAHSPWEELRGARLFLTGATGFFGAWLLESLCAANDAFSLSATAMVLTRDARAYCRKMPHLAARAELRWHEGDVRTFELPNETFTHVIHGATQASAALNAHAPRQMLETIVAGTRRVLDFAYACGASRMLMISSGAVYGTQPPDISHVSETFPGAPDCLAVTSAYAQGKRAAEFECALMAHESTLQIPVARCFAFVGPHLPLDSHFAAGNFLRDALRGDTIRVGGNGTPLRSYLYVADLAYWLWTILLRGESGRAYNVGSDEAISIAALARRCGELSGSPVEIAILPNDSDPPPRYVPDISRARADLGLDVRVGLDAALRRTCNWYLTSDVRANFE
jgi:dTDP-glucose 4,6-dehydratase